MSSLRYDPDYCQDMVWQGMIEKCPLAKGQNYSFDIPDYVDAMEFAGKVKRELEARYHTENPFIHTSVMPFHRGTDGRYCIQVWMEYSDIYAGDDIRVNIRFRYNWFAAARKAVEARQAVAAANADLFAAFGFNRH